MKDKEAQRILAMHGLTIKDLASTIYRSSNGWRCRDCVVGPFSTKGAQTHNCQKSRDKLKSAAKHLKSNIGGFYKQALKKNA